MSLTDQNTTIIVSMETRDVLRGLKRGGETYDAVINRLIMELAKAQDELRAWKAFSELCDEDDEEAET